jgi:fatty acid desaturase
MAGAVCLGMFWQQIAFIGHDTGHSGITHRADIDGCIGLVVGNLCTGVSMGWWKWTHNTHHNSCNSINHDPDVQYVPVFALSVRMCGSWFLYPNPRSPPVLTVCSLTC